MTEPKIDYREVLRLQHSGALKSADEIARDIKRATHALSGDAVLAMALDRYRDNDPAAALARLKADAGQFLRELEDAGTHLRTGLAAERERLAPVVADAARRSFAIVREIHAIDSHVASIQIHDADKRKRLTAAGLTPAELATVAAPSDTTELLSKRAELVTEGRALERFLETRDEAHLADRRNAAR